MECSTFSFAVGLPFLLLQNFQSVMTGVDWDTAYKRCSLKNDSLPDLYDVQNYARNELLTIWSSLKGQFTPWIAYRGCFKDSIFNTLTAENLAQKSSHYIDNNTVGNCYFECQSKNYTNGGCANTATFSFAVSGSICLCLCGKTPIQHNSESSKCNISCGSSIDNGECGGVGHLSLYVVMNFTIPEAHFWGFCLTCRSKSDPNNSQLYSMDCNENSTRYCVLKNETVLLPVVSEFASYWRHCEGRDMHIVRDATHNFCQKDSYLWTGLRKYKIDNSNNGHDKCYVIVIHQNTINYKMRNCTENEFFLCKNEVGNNSSVSSAGNIKITKNTEPLPLITETSRPTTTFLVTSLTTIFNGVQNPTIATSIPESSESEDI